jgi:hypothetical protein
MNIDKLKQIVTRYPRINAAYLYGTAAAGKLRPNSDIDVALFVVEPCSAKEINALETKLIGDIEAAFHREADVKILNRIEHLPLLHEIFSRGILLIDRDPLRRRNFVVKKNHEYLDFLPHYQQILNVYAERLRKHGATKSYRGENNPNSAELEENANARASQP